MTVPYFKKPQNCSSTELASFSLRARESGEVTSLGLNERIQAAARLVFCEENAVLIGIAAIKRPLDSYRFSLSRKSGVNLSQAAWPFELGWVFVAPSARGKGLSSKLVACAVEEIGAALFATSRTDNKFMQSTLLKFGFAPEGDDFPSSNGDRRIQLFTRPKLPENGCADVIKDRHRT